MLGVVGLLVLVLLGSYRRQSSRGAVRMITWVAYATCIPMVSYTTGLMQSSPCKNSLFSVWAICLFHILQSTDSLSAYSLKDNDNWKMSQFQQLIPCFWLGWLMGFAWDSDFWFPLSTVFYIALLKAGSRVPSLMSASRRYKLCESTKWVADYMSYEHDLSPTDERNPVTMGAYRYVVSGEDKLKQRKVEPPEYVVKYIEDDRAKLVTVEQIWRCQGSLLRGNGGRAGRLKDVCLSMALSKMLNRRFAGFQTLAESNLDKTHNFLFRGLLHGNSYCERAFRVIEVELAFVHDCFYTKYPLIYGTAHHVFVVLSFAMVPLCGWLAYNLIHAFKRNWDALITFLFVIVIALVEGLQVCIYLASAWCKVALVSNYVVRDSWNSREWVAKLIGCITSLNFFRSWEDKLGQYTLLKYFHYKPINFLHRVTFCLVDKTERGHKEGERVRLSMDVKEAVMETLKRSNGELTNGVTSLQANGVLQSLSSPCTNLATTTHTIMAWHIATTLCEVHDPVPRYQPSEEQQRHMETTNRHVACRLSNYCAYLVAFAPELLPDHSFVSQSIFDALVDEATQLLKGVKTLEQRCEKLREMGAAIEQDDNRLIMLGARLGNQLILGIDDPSLRWKVLCDFWAEMMLYIAPSNDATAHLEFLPRGGEFITHLWALLTHGGILERTPVPPHNI
ncbi:hypothetical protein ABZP36_009710 [Zizania latifolia]